MAKPILIIKSPEGTYADKDVQENYFVELKNTVGQEYHIIIEESSRYTDTSYTILSESGVASTEKVPLTELKENIPHEFKTGNYYKRPELKDKQRSYDDAMIEVNSLLSALPKLQSPNYGISYIDGLKKFISISQRDGDFIGKMILEYELKRAQELTQTPEK